MTINYAKKVASADRMIKKYGFRKARLRDKAGVERTCYAVQVDFTQREIMSGLVEANDQKYLISPKDLTSAPNNITEQLVTYKDDSLLTVDQVLKILRPPTQLSPGGIVIYYEVPVRKV